MRQLGNIHIFASISLRLIRSLTFCVGEMRDETQTEKSDSSWTYRGRSNPKIGEALLDCVRDR